jgi:hypothetical protein
MKALQLLVSLVGVYFGLVVAFESLVVIMGRRRTEVPIPR